MASQNVETFRAAHQAFNRRDFDDATRRLAENFTYRDHTRGETYRGREGFREFMQSWVVSFPDGAVTEPQYIDGGDVVIAEFTGRGRNDGPLGELPPTGRTINFAVCEIMRFDSGGRIVSGAIYYDQLTILTQLGHAQVPEGSTAGPR